MSLDAIKKSIISQAESKESAIDHEASDEASMIIKEAEDRAKRIIKDAESEAAREAQRMVKEAEAGADIEANSLIMSARGEAVERVLKRVMDGVGSQLSKQGMKKILDQSMKQFKQISQGGDIMIKTGRKNAPLFKDSKYEVEYGDIDGFMLYLDSGKVAINATVSSIVEHEREYARKVISSELFHAGSRRRSTQKAPKAAKQRKAAGSKAPKKAKGKKR